MSADRRLRIGVTRDFVAAPLVWGLDRPPWSERYAVEFGTAAELAERLGARALDLALLPPPLYASTPGENEIVPGLSIVTDGPARLARLEVRGGLASVRRVLSSAPGHAAETLVRVLFAASGVDVTIIAADDARADDDEAMLVTGDAVALSDPPPDVHAIDLAEAWTALTSLPMVWAVWVARAGFIGRETYAALHTARTRGKHDLERLAAQRTAEAAMAARLTGSVRAGVLYRLGRRQVDGLRRLLAEAERARVIAAAPALRFLPLGGTPGCAAGASGKPPCHPAK